MRRTRGRRSQNLRRRSVRRNDDARRENPASRLARHAESLGAILPFNQHLLRQCSQIIHDEAHVVEGLASFFDDESAVDEDGVEEGDLYEVVGGEDGRAREDSGCDAAADEVFDGVEIGRVVNDVWFFADVSEGVLHEAVDEEAAVEHDEGLVAQFADADGVAFCEGMFKARDEGAFAVKEFRVVQARAEVDGVVGEGEVEFFLLDHLKGADAAGFDDFEFDFGVCFVKFAEKIWQKNDAELERHGDADFCVAVRHVADLVVEAGDFAEDEGDFAEKFCAVACDGDFTPFAVKEVESGFGLDRLHGDSDGRLGDVELLCRLGDILPLTNFIKIPHLYKRHRVISFRRLRASPTV